MNIKPTESPMLASSRLILAHNNDVIMSAMASQITSLIIVYSTVYSGTDQRKHQSSVSLVFVRGIHWWSVISSHKGPVMRRMFLFDDIIMVQYCCVQPRIKSNIPMKIVRIKKFQMILNVYLPIWLDFIVMISGQKKIYMCYYVCLFLGKWANVCVHTLLSTNSGGEFICKSKPCVVYFVTREIV